MRDYSNVRELKICQTIEEANQLLSEGWILFDIFSETQSLLLGRTFLLEAEILDFMKAWDFFANTGGSHDTIRT